VNSATQIAARAGADHLSILGICAIRPEDNLRMTTGSLILLGPAEPGFWAHVTAQPEWRDATPDPIDRWSRRVIGRMAGDLGAEPLFPFGGPPNHPFYSWALRSGESWISPVRLLVHERQGLWVSFRGALALPEPITPAPTAPRNPCESCTARPCLVACPAVALTGAGYDLPACHRHLDGPDGKSCLDGGCAVRIACPTSQAYGRLARQSAYHMRQFHP
jgi:hypothetical protein